MDPATVIALIQAFSQLAGQAPELIGAGKTVIELLQTGAAPTPEQQAQIDAALETANNNLQKS